MSKLERKPTKATMVSLSEGAVSFAKAPIALLVADGVSYRLHAMNEAACESVGIDCRSWPSRTLLDIFLPLDFGRIESALREASISRSSGVAQVVSDCRIGPASLLAVDLTIQHQEDTLFSIALVDASPRLKLEQQLRQASKMEAVGMLAGGIAHEFNNLLTIISGYSQMLQTSPQMVTERDRTAVEQVLKASQRAADLTAQLLTFSRRRNIEARVIEPARLIDQTTLMLRRLIGEHIDLQIEQEAGAGRIRADVSQIQQVVMNLVINSRDAMPDGGILMIETRNAELDSRGAQKLGVNAGSYVMIAVSDTGNGIDSTSFKQVFEPFFTTKAHGKGTGLGLSTVSGIVKQCGGAIELTSELGHGTTFKVFFPRVNDVATEESAEVIEPSGGSETILVAEDEEGVRRMVTTSLERRGYRVLVAASGKEALEVSRKFDGPIHLLVSDIVMPQMNGKELAEHLLEERPGTPILFISGYPGEPIGSVEVSDAEMPFLQKPFAPALLTYKVRELIDKERGESNIAGR